MASKQQPQGVLLVVERGDGPAWYGKWRDGERRQVKRRLGPAWLTRGAGGAWVPRRGRRPESHLDARAATVALQRLIDERENELIAARGRRRPAQVTFAQAAEAWLEHGRVEREWKWTTYCDYRLAVGRLARELGDRTLHELTRADLDAALARLRPQRNGATVRERPSRRMADKYASLLRQTFAFALENGWCTASPAAGLRNGRRRRVSKNAPLRREEYFTPEEVHAILREARRTADSPRIYLPASAVRGRAYVA